jgi:hypothetical protein
MRMPQYTAEACLSPAEELRQRPAQRLSGSSAVITPQLIGSSVKCCQTFCFDFHGVEHCHTICTPGYCF